MKNCIPYILFLFSCLISAQSISVDTNTYTAQQLVENVLINSGCIENIQVTNTVSGDFPNDKSFGYFNRNGSSFPYQEGIVMSTGSLGNVPGPNDNLSNDGNNAWSGDTDLENALSESDTYNATIIEFDFTPIANSIRFNYIFASEEYSEGFPCYISDIFAFLIKPIGGTYENIALIPNTLTPVKVTTIHPKINTPGESCPAENEEYFAGYNAVNSPINFNGQTTSLVAQTSVTPNTTYHIKLVIADQQDAQYDSAVFLEGGSFDINADLGTDKTGTDALCEGESLTLEPVDIGVLVDNFNWYRVENGTESLLSSGPNENQYTITQPGTYKVEVNYGNGCIADGTTVVEYIDFSDLDDQIINTCDINTDGLSTFTLTGSNENLTDGNPQFSVADFFLTETEAENNQNPIANPENFENTEENQIVYARVESSNGCFTVLALTLSTSSIGNAPIDFISCSDDENQTLFVFDEIIPSIQAEINTQNDVTFYRNINHASSESNPLGTSILINNQNLPLEIYARIENLTNTCEDIVPINLISVSQPAIDPEKLQQQICLDNSTQTTLNAPVQGSASNYTFEWENGETSSQLVVDAAGTYSVEITKTENINNNSYSCTTQVNVTVIESEKANIDYLLEGKLGDFSVRILTQGIGDYVYALDTGSFQDHPVFPVDAGEHTLFVKDRKGCGIASLAITVIDYMRFFTPNNDGYNDFWKIKNTSREQNMIDEIFIFDRYGKLIKAMSAFDAWDGTFQGKNLPADDYWFKIKLKNGQELKEHFTLIR